MRLACNTLGHMLLRATSSGEIISALDPSKGHIDNSWLTALGIVMMTF